MRSNGDRGGIFWWLEAKYYSRNKHKVVDAFVGPFDSQMEAETYARDKIVPEPDSDYTVHSSVSKDRDEARRACIFGNTDEVGLDNALHPYSKEVR